MEQPRNVEFWCSNMTRPLMNIPDTLIMTSMVYDYVGLLLWKKKKIYVIQLYFIMKKINGTIVEIYESTYCIENKI